MNAQTNFQQFVSSNQGKLITFLHNDKQVSKVVVDIQGEYFTGKTNVSDAKIDGFYYFSDCKMVDEKHPLIAVLEKYKIVVLHLSIGRSCIFNYNHYTAVCRQVKGTCLSTSQPIGFHVTSIDEAWSIVDGQYKLVYHKPTQEFKDEISLEDVLSSNKDVTIETLKCFPNFNLQSIDGGIIIGTSNGVPTGIKSKSVKRVLSKDGKELYVNKYFDNSEEPASTVTATTSAINVNRDAEKYEVIKREFEQFKKLEKLLFMYAPKHVIDFINALSTIKSSPFSTKALNDFSTVFEAVKSELVEVMKMKLRRDPLLQAFVKRLIELVMLIKPNDNEVKDLLNNINRIITPEGKVEYEKITTDKKELENQKKYEVIKNEVDNLFNNKTEKNIKYRGKPKTVLVMSEYTHLNGNHYVLVKDLSDNGKTKTLFKEYIEWL